MWTLHPKLNAWNRVGQMYISYLAHRLYLLFPHPFCTAWSYVSQALLPSWSAHQWEALAEGWLVEEREGTNSPLSSCFTWPHPAVATASITSAPAKGSPCLCAPAVPGLSWAERECGLWWPHILLLPLCQGVSPVSWHYQYLYLHFVSVSCLMPELSHHLCNKLPILNYLHLKYPVWFLFSWRSCLPFQIYFISSLLSH